MSTTLLTTEVEATSAEQRIQAAFEAAQAPKAAVASAQLSQVVSVSIEGHPKLEYNGVYTHDSAHKGWPVLKSDKGMYCFRFAPRDEWRLGDKHSPDEDWSYATKVSEGPLAVGASVWECWAGGDDDGKWEDHSLTVTLQ